MDEYGGVYGEGTKHYGNSLCLVDSGNVIGTGLIRLVILMSKLIWLGDEAMPLET